MAARLPVAVVVLQLALPGAAYAGGAADSLAIARELFLEGEYAQALSIYQELKNGPDLSREQRIDCLKHLAFSLYLSSQKPRAREVWIELLRIDPDHAFDPNWDSPVLIAYFEKIEPPPPPTAVETEIIIAAPAETQEVEAEVSASTAESLERGCGVALCLLPFGVGQFANEQYFKGSLFLLLEVGLTAAIIALQFERQAVYDSDPVGFDEGADEGKAMAQNVMFYVAVGALVTGIVDAFLLPDWP